MPDEDATSAERLLTRYEAVVKELIRSVLGADWQRTPGIDLDELGRRREHEAATRRGAAVSTDLLDYVDHRRLTVIVNKRWQDFAAILGSKKRWDVYVDRIADLRNAPMHGRALLHFERDLLAGMTGEIANIVAQYRSSRGPDSAWYPVVESVTDSLGNAMARRRVPPRLTVGDNLIFTCVGSDPQDRPLHWRLTVLTRQGHRDASAVGDRVELTWTVERGDVGEETRVMVTMTAEAEFHRYGDYDDSVGMTYAVNPPPG